jgi:hypothetical protein
MTTTADYRAALSELADRLENWNSAKPHHDDMEAVRSARALLAVPEAVGVSNGQLVDLAGDHLGFDLTPDEEEGVIEFARAVLSRYGTHQAPVPVGERLPGAGDLKDGHCWWWHEETGDVFPHWVFAPASVAENQYLIWLPHWALPLPEAQP